MARPRLKLGAHGAIFLTQRDSYWRARVWFRDFDGKRRLVEATGRTQGIARSRLQEKLQERREVAGGDGIQASTTVEALFNEWLNEIRQSKRTPQTVDRYEDCYRNHGRPRLGSLTLSEATVSILDRVIKNVASTTPSQAYTLRVVLRQMFAMAVRHDALPTNPADATATVERKKPKPVSLKLDDIALLRAAVRNWRQGEGRMGPRHNGYLATAVDVMLGTGARISEALALRWQDFDLSDPDAATVQITATLTRRKGVGLFYQEHPKSKSSDRVLHLPRFTVDSLLDFRPNDAQAGDYVFSTKNDTPMDPHNVSRSLRSALAEAGLAHERWSPHKLRVTVATTLTRNGGIEDAAAVLGHAGTEITRAHYVERLRQAPDVASTIQALIDASDALGEEA